ncbi:MAG: hypothetical protein KDA42_08575, partial [Planctomycetales bacterium]|nr:hypothetical protein [Planctomycetales bacterium]
MASSAISSADPTIINALREKIAGFQRTLPSQSSRSISTGIPALDSVLPDHGWPAGSLVEWVA